MMEEFMSITGITTEQDALHWLEMCNYDLESAINLFLTSAQPPPAAPQAVFDPYDPYVDDFMDIRKADPVKRQRLVEHEEGPAPKRKATSAFSSGSGFVPQNLKEQALTSMYRAPTDLMMAAGFEEAKEAAQLADKWLLVNIQDETEFACHVLNRDFWSSADVKDLVLSSFVFWQQLSISQQGAQFIDRYKVTAFPFVAILDPATGACRWRREGRDKVQPQALAERLQDYLGDRPSPSSQMQKQQVVREDEQTLQQALAMSMEAAPILIDPPSSSSSSSSAGPAVLAPLGGFSADEVLTVHCHDCGVSGKHISMRIRMPWGNPVTAHMSSTQPLQQLLCFIAQQVPEADRSKRFDVSFGHPLVSLSELLKGEGITVESSLETVGLSVSTLLNFRYL